jgi:predicted 3-demethylubiquinone-9 3-methyltransferase (glyoxalase superfamily)
VEYIGDKELAMQKIKTFLTFNDRADEAARFYTSVFKDSSIERTTHTPDGGVLTVEFRLEGQDFVALNGGPYFKFTEGISLSVTCEDQQEVDYYWSKLTEGGEESECGWLKDPFGVSWQITPRQLMEAISDPDPEKSKRAIDAMMQMQKIDIATIERAVEGM